MGRKQPGICLGIKVFRHIVNCLPHKMAIKLGAKMGRIVAFFSKKKVNEATVRCADRLNISNEEARKIVLDSYRHFGADVAEFIRMPKISDHIEQYVHLEGEANLKKAYEKNKGVIFATAHMGNWEYAACLVAKKGYKMCALGAEQRDERITNLINELRSKSGIEALTKANLRTVIKCLKEGKIIGLPVDQDAKKQGVLSMFLGKPASTPVGIAKFAYKTGCAVIPAISVRNEDLITHTTYILPALEGRDGKVYGEDIQTSIDDCNDILSHWIKKYPRQWLWLYPRWESYDRGYFDESWD